jgi:hypothetical protein
VESIWENLSWCTIEATYNWNPQATTCTVKAPTITVKLWYNEENKRWKKVWWDDEKSEWDTITLNKSESSITYEASTDINTYTIGYLLNSWTVTEENPTSYTVESWDISLNNPTRTWHTFEWWSWTNLPDKTINVTIRNWSTWDRAYEANWKANKYEVRYKANGWEWDDVTEEATYDTKYIFTGNIFTREWYTFKEWNTKADW